MYFDSDDGVFEVDSDSDDVFDVSGWVWAWGGGERRWYQLDRKVLQA